MKYLKISFIIFFIFVYGCATDVIYVDKGKQIDPEDIPLNKKIVFEVHDEYKKNPITCLAIYPFQFSSKIDADEKEKENIRKIFYAYISPLPIGDVELSRINYLKDKFPEDNFGKLTLRENCNSYFIGKINVLKISSFAVVSKNSIGGTFAIYNSKNKNLVWEASHIVTSTGGKIPLSPIDIVVAAVEAHANTSEEQKFRIMGDLARRISKTIPVYDLDPQAMFKINEEIQFDKIKLVITEDSETSYINNFDKILVSNIDADKKIELIEPVYEEIGDDKKLKYIELLIENNRYENALKKLNNFDISENHYVFFLKSRVLIALREYNQADQEIIKAIRLNKENYQYYNVLGFINSKNDNLDRSLAAYKIAIEKNKNNAFAYFNSGIIYTILNYNDVAVDYLYTAGLLYHKIGAQLDVLSVINQLELIKSKPARTKLKKLKKIANL